MATMWMTTKTPSLFLQFQTPNDFTVRCLPLHVLTRHTSTTINFCSTKQNLSGRSLNPCISSGEGRGCFLKPISAVGSGLEASITDPKDNAIAPKNVNINVESQDDDKIQLRVDVMGEDTQIIFDKVLANLARTAPPVPGFRREKGGKTSKVPKDFLLQVIGEDRVTKFVIQEIVNTTLADYVKKENLKVKENKVSTIQTAPELKSSFSPGKEFGFNATLELEKPEPETSSSDTEDTTEDTA